MAFIVRGMDEPNRFELIGYLEEALCIEAMTRVEDQLRTSQEWRDALLELLQEVDSQDHSVATIWRRHRLTCPSREQLGAYAFGGLPPDLEDYIQFHLETLKCRWCQANLSDVEAQEKANQSDEGSSERRRRIFASSVGCLPLELKK